MKRSKMPSSREETGSTRARGLIETLVVIALILTIPLFFAIKTRATRQEMQSTTTSAIQPKASAPEESAAINPQQPEACTFPLVQTEEAESVPDEYTFSEPQIVEANLSNIYDIAEWLPDNQRVLITQMYQEAHYQSIDLLNPRTGEIQVYATRKTIPGEPVWLAKLNAVVYPLTTLVNSNTNNPRAFQPPYHQKQQLWISQGNPDAAAILEEKEMTVNHGSFFSVAANPNGNQIIYLDNTGGHPVRRNVSTTSFGTAQSLSFDPARSAYQQKDPNSILIYKMSWRPGSKQVLLYTEVSRPDQWRYTFLIDSESGDVCEIKLSGETPAGRPAVNLSPRWSPNGRYLAVISVGGFNVLDTVTSRLYEVEQEELISAGVKGQISINDIDWAPDNRHLAAAIQVADYSVSPGENYIQLRKLYVIDFLTRQAVPIPSDIMFGVDFGRRGLLWSDNGSELLVRCSAGKGLCLLSVHRENRQH